jgi:hypothetical protein
VASEVGVGTEFSFVLTMPRVQTAQTAAVRSLATPDINLRRRSIDQVRTPDGSGAVSGRSASADGTSPTSPPNHASALNGVCIIADDNPLIQKLLARFVEETGLRPVVFSDGIALAEYFERLERSAWQ